MQLGTLIYGYISHRVGSVVPTVGDRFYFTELNSTKTKDFPAPFGTESIMWFSNNSPRPNGHEVKLEEENEKLKMYINVQDCFKTGAVDDAGYNPTIHWSYFCYTKSPTGFANPNQ